MCKKLNLKIPGELLNKVAGSKMFLPSVTCTIFKANKEEIQYSISYTHTEWDMSATPIHRHHCNHEFYDSLINIVNKDIPSKTKQILLSFLLAALTE